MSRVLIAGVVSLLISILLGPKFIAFLRRNEFGQHIREEGPERHVLKQGTPVMGGLLILLSASVGFLAFSTYTVPALTVLFVTLGCGAIGFLDDFIKLTHRRSLGLNGRWKLMLLGLITIGVGIAAEHQHLPTNVYVPGAGHIELSFGFYVLLFLIIAGAANGVNLTDGIDGLAVGVGMIALITFTAMNVVTWIRSASSTELRDASASTSRSWARRSPVARSASSGTTPSRPRCSWATPARWRSAARSGPSRS